MFFCLFTILGLFINAHGTTHKENAGIYNSEYWKYQMPQGQEGAILDLFKFEEFIQPSNTVIDLGCGGGYLLSMLPGEKKIGIEINENAHSIMRSLGIEVYSDSNAVPNEIADVIISNHALEHVFNPYEVLCELYKKLKPKGLLIIVVPSEQARNDYYNYKEEEPNHHVYTWTPQTLGNLIKYAGFKIEKAEALRHCWVDNFYEESRRPHFSLQEYHERCRKAAIKQDNYQVRVIARKI